jgi:uncharacterized protein YlaI
MAVMVVKVIAFPVIVSCAGCDANILIENQTHYVTATGSNDDLPVNSYICEACFAKAAYHYRVVSTAVRQRGQVW